MQYVTTTATQTTISRVATGLITNPVQPNQQTTGNKAIVMELLKVQFQLGTFSERPADDGFLVQVQSGVLSLHQVDHDGLVINNLGDPTTLAAVTVNNRGFTPLAQGEFEQGHDLTHWHDLTDGAGHGILVAAPTLQYQYVNTGQTAGGQQTSYCRLWYRIKKVSLTEFVGMLASQGIQAT